jgi:recombination protein RecA
MAAKKKDGAEDIFSQMAQDTGAQVVANLDVAKYFIDTGNLAINYCCSGKFATGGIPGGRLTEIYGPSASSKSLIGTNILAGVQKLGGIGIILDTENAINGQFIQQATKCDINKIIRYTPVTLEDCFGTIYRAIEYIRQKKKIELPVVIVYDSISVSPSARELRETQLPEGYSKADFKRIVGANEQPGERAKICSKELRKLNTEMEQNDVTVVILNQIRDKIGVMYGCFHYTSRVILADGSSMKIGKIVNQKLSVEVLSYNSKTNKIEPKKVIAWHKNGNLKKGESFIQFTAKKSWGNGATQFGCTPNHMLFVYQNGEIIEKAACQLKIGDKLAQIQAQYLTKDQKQVVYGSILGDGSLRKNKSCTSLRINHGRKQTEYCRWKEAILSPWIGYSFSEEKRVGFDTIPMCELNNLKFRNSPRKNGVQCRDCLIPEEVINNLDVLGLAVWYLDDGSFSGSFTKWGKGKCIIYSLKFKNKNRMKKVLKDKFGLDCKISDRGIVFDSENTYKLHGLIAPFVHPCMNYKLHPDFRNLFDYKIEEVDESKINYGIQESEITEIYTKPPTRSSVKFDITVEGNHTYVVDGAIVHNSPETTAAGGQGLPFYASLRIRSQTQKKIESKITGSAKKKVLGINIKIQNKKNRSYRPFVEVDNIPLYFDKGINPLGGILGALIDAGRIVPQGGGKFLIKPEFCNNEEITFRSSMDRNDIPLEIAYKYPLLLDAESELDIRSYLDPHLEAINFECDSDVSEVSDDDGEIDDLLG